MRIVDFNAYESMRLRRYLSFGVEFFSGGCRDTTAFVWAVTLRGDMLKKDLARLAGGFTARENLDHFGGDETPFLRLMAGLVADAADPPMTPRRRQIRLFAQPERPRGRAR